MRGRERKKETQLMAGGFFGAFNFSEGLELREKRILTYFDVQTVQLK